MNNVLRNLPVIEDLRLRVSIVAGLWMMAMFVMPSQLQILLIGGVCFNK
jgi:hypothetical protein